MLTVPNLVLNTAPSVITVQTASGGTVWGLTAAGTYAITYEMSNTGSTSCAVYTGAAAGTLAIDNNSIGGSATSTSWWSCRHALTVGGSTVFFGISSVVGNIDVPVSGSAAGFYMVRVSIQKVA